MSWSSGGTYAVTTKRVFGGLWHTLVSEENGLDANTGNYKLLILHRYNVAFPQ